MNKTKRNVIIAVILLLVLLAAPFGPKLKQAVTGGRDTAEQVHCTVAVSCAAADGLIGEESRFSVPADGWLLPQTTVTLSAGSTVLDALYKTGIAVETAGSPAYVTAVGGLSAGDAGEQSGWTYTVNGETVMTGCSQLTVQAGDEILWTYVTTWE